MMKHVFNVANGDRPHVPDTAIVITDGRSTYDSNLTIPYAEEAKRRGIKIIGLYSVNKTNTSHLFIYFICLLITEKSCTRCIYAYKRLQIKIKGTISNKIV